MLVVDLTVQPQPLGAAPEPHPTGLVDIDVVAGQTTALADLTTDPKCWDNCCDGAHGIMRPSSASCHCQDEPEAIGAQIVRCNALLTER